MKVKEISSVQLVVKYDRLAGLFYILVAIFAGFAQFQRISMILPMDTSSTISNIIANQTVFRMGIVSDLIGQIIHIFLILSLYEVFKGIDRKVAFLMAILGIIPVPIACINLASQLQACQIIANPDNDQQLLAIAMIGQQANGVFIAQIFWGLWLLPLGYVLIKSGVVLRIFGFALILSGIVYVVGSIGTIITPEFDSIIKPRYLIPSISEMGFGIWLLLVGIKKI